MKTESVTVGMGATIPHPTMSFANLKADVRYTIRLEDGDGTDAYEQAGIKLRLRADRFLKDTLSRLVEDCQKRAAARTRAVAMSCDTQNFERANETDIPF